MNDPGSAGIPSSGSARTAPPRGSDDSVHIIVALGSNLGDSRRIIECAIREINDQCQVLRCSSLYLTKPVGYTAQPDFINAVLSARTVLEPHALLDFLQMVEGRHQRRRSFRNAPRTLDLDLICYGQLVVSDERLTLPHQRMHERAFVLVPLLEIEPELLIAGLNRRVRELCAALDQHSLQEAVRIDA